MRTRLAAISFVLGWAVLRMPFGASAQSNPTQINSGNATGLIPYTAYGGVRENINLTNGNLNLQVPLLSLPGRNGQDLQISLIYDSKMWTLHGEYYGVNGKEYWWEYEGHPQVGELGWRLNLPYLYEGVLTYDSGMNSCYVGFIVAVPDGSKHSFSNRAQCTYPAYTVSRTDAEDGSFLTLDTSNESDVVVYMKDGTRIHFPGLSGYPSKIVDSDGNVITFQKVGAYSLKIVDTVGRETTANYSGPFTLNNVTYKDSNGDQRQITFNYASVWIEPSFALPQACPTCGVAVYPYPPRYHTLLSAVTLPNNLQYSFQYTPYAELSKLTYPAGGYTAYDFGRYVHKWYFWGVSALSTAADFRELISRRVCDDPSGVCTQESTTIYTPTITPNHANNQFMEVLDAEGHRTKYEFSQGTYVYFSAREVNREVYQVDGGQSTLLRTVVTDYTDVTPQHWSLPIRVTTTLNDTSPNQVTKTEWTYDTYTAWRVPFSESIPFPPVQQVTRPIDNPTEVREYHYGSGAAGSLARKTVNVWLKTNPVNQVDYFEGTGAGGRKLHIWDRKGSETVRDGAGNAKAQTQFEYDSYTEGLTTSGAVQDDASWGTGYTTRGNLTATQRWRNTDAAWLTTRHQYDDAGNVRKMTDPLTHSATFSYADSWANTACSPAGGNAAAYLTSTANHLGHVTSSTYNSCTGTVASTTDPNNRTTSHTYDSLGRLRTASFPDGGSITVTYNEPTKPLSITTTKKITASLDHVSSALLDGLGRLVQSRLDSNPQGAIITDTTYDALDRKATISNPYVSTSDPTYGLTTYTYDALGRMTAITRPDGSLAPTAYAGNCATVTDEAGKKRKSCTDALGRVTQVYEDPDALNYLTSYTYDVLDNLTGVTQGVQTRTFQYDSLSRLTSAANPETAGCPSTYTYDANGNLLTRVAPRPNQTNCSTKLTTTYAYDELNRVTSKTYDDGTPPAYFFYDEPSFTLNGTLYTLLNPKPRLTHTVTGNPSVPTTATIHSYDAVGRIYDYWQCTPFNCGSASIWKTEQRYDLAGNLNTWKSPRNELVTNTINAAGRITRITSSKVDSTHPAELAAEITYWPSGAVKTLLNGAVAGGTQRLETYDYNNRLQLYMLQLGTAADPDANACTVYNHYAGSAPASCPVATPPSGSGDNGNVLSYRFQDNVTTLTPDMDHTASFTYDALNRLTNSTASGSQSHNLTYSYDRYGNGACTGGTGLCTQLSFDANNRISGAGYAYDAAGNTTQDGTPVPPYHTYQWDAAGRLKSVDSGATTNIVYNALGQRAERHYVGHAYPYREYVYDGFGNNIGEHKRDAWYYRAFPFGGTPLAKYISGGTRFYHHNHLGSTTAVADHAGTPTEKAIYYPFGQLWNSGGTLTDERFASLGQRDWETSLDPTPARMYESRLYRWLSPDPAGKAAAKVTNPQTWNRYVPQSGMLNNPVNLIGPSGD